MNPAQQFSSENASELSAMPFVVCQAIEIRIIECPFEVHISFCEHDCMRERVLRVAAVVPTSSM
jgi:hypothetical protein